MPQTSRRTRRERRIKRQNTLLYRGLVHQTKQLNVANALIQRMVNPPLTGPADVVDLTEPEAIEPVPGVTETIGYAHAESEQA